MDWSDLLETARSLDWDTIVGVDPGLTTGVATLCASEGTWTSSQLGDGDARDILDCPARPGGALLVVEKPIVTSGSFTAVRHAVEVYGFLRIGWCSTRVDQTPAARKIATKCLLQKSGAWAATVGKPHARDAAQHVLAYLIGQTSRRLR